MAKKQSKQPARLQEALAARATVPSAICSSFVSRRKSKCCSTAIQMAYPQKTLTSGKQRVSACY